MLTGEEHPVGGVRQRIEGGGVDDDGAGDEGEHIGEDRCRFAPSPGEILSRGDPPSRFLHRLESHLILLRRREVWSDEIGPEVAAPDIDEDEAAGLVLQDRHLRLRQSDEKRVAVLHLMHLLICGIALYYVYKRLMDKPRISLLAILMLGVGTVFNPIYVPDFQLTTWLIIEIISMVLFFVCSLREKLPVPGDDEKK